MTLSLIVLGVISFVLIRVAGIAQILLGECPLIGGIALAGRASGLAIFQAKGQDFSPQARSNGQLASGRHAE